MTTRSRRPARWRRRAVAASGALLLGASLMTATAASAGDDPRVDLPAGLDTEVATSGVELLDSLPLPGGFVINSDLAFTGDKAIVGSFSGFQVYDISDPAAPVLDTAFVCPGGQGDVSVYGDLLFMSVEATNGRIDCGTQGAAGAVNLERFRGVRIFDISDLSNPVQLEGVQTCRGSHTHTVVADPDDTENVYIYNSGTAGVRSALELEGCENAALTTEPVTEGNPTQWRIDVIKVPLDAPGDAEIVSQPRIFTDVDTGAYNGLQNTQPGAQHPSGIAYSPLPNTNTCHDVTAFPEIGLLAGACQGNGILVDISDPVNPVRIDAVADTNFSYWHSATFNNDGTKVIFTDEWGGGTQARCQEIHQPEWGANALFDIVDGKLEFASYYKLPVPQTATENCVAHNGSVIPVPGRDIMVQAWYQGGMSIFDFTDTENPVEIAYLDRGPIDANALVLGGYWSTYWYNGNVLGSEIARGFDTMELAESAMMSANEIGAAGEIQLDEFNAQMQSMLVHAPSYNVARSYVDQAERAGTLSGAQLDKVNKLIDKAEASKSGKSAFGLLTAAASESGFPADSDLVQGLKALAASLR
jgi:hypothetical protein